MDSHFKDIEGNGIEFFTTFEKTGFMVKLYVNKKPVGKKCIGNEYRKDLIENAREDLIKEHGVIRKDNPNDILRLFNSLMRTDNKSLDDATIRLLENLKEEEIIQLYGKLGIIQIIIDEYLKP